MGQKRPNNAQTEPVLLPVKAIIQHYNGIGCLSGLVNIIENALNDDYDLTVNSPTDLTISLLRLYEHRLNIKRALDLLDSNTHGCISTNSDLLEQYLTSIGHMKKCYLMAKKWSITGNAKLLSSICEIFKNNIIKEGNILRVAFGTVRQYLDSKITV